MNSEIAFQIQDQFGTPCYVYDEAELRSQADKILNFPNAFGLTARYAMKASSNANILRLFDSMGLHIDASSGYEVRRAVSAGIAPEKISLSTQELPADIKELMELGISLNACSLNQLEVYGQLFPGGKVGLRFNPGLGSGGTQRTNVGGPASSFGIWHEYIAKVKDILATHDLHVFRIHTHIGSGSDADVWIRAVSLSLEIVKQFETVTTLNLGGGYKVGRMPDEKTTDIDYVGEPMKQMFLDFAQDTGRKIHLEVEPGTYLVANSCTILSRIQDTVSTGDEGYEFIKLDTGMTDNVRPSMYGAQHPMTVFPADPSERGEQDYIVVGHCCESGDILTPMPGDPEALNPRTLTGARVGDLFAIGGAGAYCASMPTKNYNSFPESAEVLLRADKSIALIRKRQELEDIYKNEVRVDL
ncbi:MAG: diaminopimelate decarboxylase [Verrucomicrobiota bacterium]